MKILLKKLPKKEFKKQIKHGNVPQDAGAITQSRNYNKGTQWRIQINKELPSKVYQKIFRHEEGHVFAEKQKLSQKLSREQKKMLVEVYGTRLAPRQSSQYKLQETLAETYRALKYHKKAPLTKGFRKMAPKTSKIIADEIKKFKPQYKQIN